MGRRHGKKAKQQQPKPAEGEEQPAGAQQPEYVQPADPPRAVVAVHPAGSAIAVAVGPELRVYDARSGQHKTLVTKPDQPAPAAQQPAHAARAAVPFLRGVAFDAAGRFLLAGSEDKAQGLRLWDATSWELLQSIKVPKKVTSVAFTADGSHVLAADKFGDVLVAAAERPAGLAEGQQQEPELLLGHYCAIITSLSLSAGGRLLATTDRDNRVRVSVVPADPMTGAHEIQSFCFGHTAFVTCSAFAQHDGQELLVTGSGDGTLRLWDPLEGSLLHTLDLPRQQQQEQQLLPQPQPGEEGGAGEAAAEGSQQAQAQGQGQQEGEDGQGGGGAAADAEQRQRQQEGRQAAEEGDGSQDEGEEEEAEAAEQAGEERQGEEGCSRGGGAPTDAPVPLALAAAPDGRGLVAAVDGRDELCLLQLDWASRRLREAGWFALPGLHLPACLTFDASGRLWAAGGPVADDSAAAFIACGTVEQGGGQAEGSGQAGAAAVAAAPLPDWLPQEAVAALEAKAGNEGALLQAAAERRRLASQLLQKRKFSLQQLEHRKRLRRDKVAAAAAAVAKQGAAEAGEAAS